MSMLAKKLMSKISRICKVLCLRANLHHKSLDLTRYLDQDSKLSRALDIGSGPHPRNPFGANSVFGVDIRTFDLNKNVKRCIVGSDSLPYKDNFFDAVTAYDVLEHIPRVLNKNESVSFPFVSAMNEIWRVLKVGGFFYSETPCYPMKEAFQDPTHVNIMTEDTLRLYFSDKSWARIYGFVGSFVLIAEGWLDSHYFCILKKVSDAPVFEINESQKK